MDLPNDNKLGRSVHSQKNYFLIDAFLFKAEPLLNFRCYELRSLFYQTTSELILSEVEIIAWLICVEKIGMNSSANNIKEFLFFAGLHAKMCLGSDVYFFLERFKEKNPRIIEKFKVWSSLNNQKSNISTIELSKKYRELSVSHGISKINLNFYLDNTLRLCTTYQKQTIDIIFDFSLEVGKYHYEKENIFEVKNKSKAVEDQDYDLREFDNIDT